MNKNYTLPNKGANFSLKRTAFWSGKLYLCWLFFFGIAIQNSNAQTITTVLDPNGAGGFALGNTFESNGWTVENATSNAWSLGSVPGWFTGNGAFISNDSGTTWAYGFGTTNASHFYTDVDFPTTSDIITLKFDWRGNGNDGNWDNLQVYIIDTSITPTTAGPVNQATTTTGWDGYTDGTTGYYLTRISGSSVPTTTTTVSYTFTAAQRTYVAGSTKRLVFVWKNDNAGGANPPASVDNISIVSTAFTCYPPTAILATQPTSNGAIITWTPPNDAPGEGYDYYISTTNTAPTTQNPTGNTSDSPLVLNNLPANTTHYIWVRGNCGENDKSIWSSSVSFTTLCEPYVLTTSYSNNFTTFPGACWTRSNAGTLSSGPTGTGNGNWTSKAYLNGTGNTSATFNLYGNTTADSHWLISPAIDLGTNVDYRLKYNVGLTEYNSTTVGTKGIISSDVIEVVISEDEGATWSVLQTYDANNVPLAAGSTEIIDLSNYQGVIKIAFLITDNLDATSLQDADFFIDEFVVEPIPACDAPTALVVENITTNSADFSWQPGQTIPANGYQYFVSETNTAPTTDGTDSSNTTVTLALSPSTTYYAWARAICGAGNASAWVMSAVFSTLCDEGTVPYTVNIDAVTTPALPQCIVVQNVNGDNKTWQTYAAQTGITGKVMGYPWHGTNDADDWFFLRGLDLTAGTSYRIKFKYKDSGFVEKLRVSIGQNPIDADMGTELFDVTTGDDSVVVSEAIDFTVDADGIYYIGFQAHSDANQFNLYVGEISVIITPTEEVDFANVESFKVGQNAVNAIQKCQTVDVYAQANEPNATEPDGQTAGLLAWIGYSVEDTDPSTWPESAWSAATYSSNAGSNNTNDEFKKSFSGLTVGTKYFASRFQLNEGPFVYGATNGIWNGANNSNAILEVVEPTTIDAGNDVTICAGEVANLAVTSANASYTYSWGTAGTSANVSVTPTTTMTYTVTGTDSVTGCTTTDMVTVIVNDAPTAIVFETTDYEICNGAVQILTAAGGAVSTEVYTEDFNQPTNDWTAENTSTGGTPANGDWTLRESGYSYGTFGPVTFTSNDASQFYLANSDAQGSSSIMATSLTSPVIDLSGYVGASMSFYHYYRYNSTESAKVQVSVDGGNEWNDVATYTSTQGTAAAFVKATLDLTTYAGNANVQIRFKYAATWDYYWAIDNVVVSGSKPQIVWAPQTGLFLDAQATIPYAGTPSSTVYVKGSATTPSSYVASAENAAGCSVETSIQLTVKAAVDAPVAAAEQTFDTGETLADLDVTGADLTWYTAATGGTELPTTTVLVNQMSYFVSQTVNGCESPRVEILATEILSIPGFEKSSLKAYPNPVAGVLTINNTNVIDTVQVFNLLGQRVFESKFSANEVKIDMTQLAAGTYMVNVTSNGSVKNIKVIKK